MAKPTWPTYACLMRAAHAYHLSPWAIIGIMKAEGGKPGQIVRDANGTFDMGPMQINSLWLPRLASQGITAQELASNGCLNVKVGAAILRLNINQAGGNLVKGIGWYHSRIPTLAQQYRLRVSRQLERIANTPSSSN
ncbi:lytic transglycosylase domain-containing protein [Acidihalobacter ferrooxydans]|uniref:Transglycosylase SLT domain-containing protein n=1 Tax=Acidihalobacter ferrooxydans TaxID=1765967 RepID=A0A1P8UL55_9GAMM|nr:lytic transglycosylase domain-containing protein [Acidihalobacter ferrooxydans]APZ44559.1 hypothetical protein BW247_05655 [Acidihalobacter ferrooxydans]